MWEGATIDEDPLWVAQAMTAGTLICVTDGSYDRRKAYDLSGAGWTLYCTATKKQMSGSLVERSEYASSYRGELLGMLAIHIFLHAVEKYFHAHGGSNSIYCDNKGAIYTFAKQHKRVSAGIKNNDILRVLRRVQHSMASSHSHTHVKAHQDDARNRNSLLLPAQLNCHCDDLAKAAVIEAVFDRTYGGIGLPQPLPLEVARVYIAGNKQTTDLSKALRFHVGKAQARQFCIDERLMEGREFDEVDWENLNDIIQCKPRMYQLWFGKQGSGYCGTGKMLARRDPTAENKCPNCGRPEDAIHLNRCGNNDRRRLLSDSTDSLVEWMEDNNAHPELIYWIPQYIKRQGYCAFTDLNPMQHGLRKMSQSMRAAGHAQDLIGWRHFMEGKISKTIRRLQEFYLLGCDTNMAIDAWMRGFISKILEISHSQWIFRNLTKHHHTNGTISLAAREEVLREVERQLDLGLTGLPDKSKCLLEIDQMELYQRSTEGVQDWLNAVLAARAASEHARRVSAGRTCSWAEVTQDVTYAHLPTTAPPSPSPTSDHEDQAAPTTASLPAQPNPTEDAPGKHGPPTDTIALPALTNANVPQSARDASRPRKRTKRKQQSRQHAPTMARPVTTSLTTSRDKMKMLQGFAEVGTANERCQVTRELKRSLPKQRDGSHFDLVYCRQGTESLNLSSFLTLQPETWVTDKVINYVTKRVLQPALPRRHFYSSFFFTRLLQHGYNFQEVTRWAGRIPDGLHSIDELYVPINKGNAHWLFLRVHFPTKTIALYDSMGRKANNGIYLNAMRRYLYDEHAKTTNGPVDTFAAWARAWTVVDSSDSSPRQQNGDDCGIFTLVSMAMLIQGIRLTPRTYTQELITNNDIRRRLAHTIWTSRLPPTPGVSRLDQWLRDTPASTSKTQTPVLPRKQAAPKSAGKTVAKQKAAAKAKVRRDQRRRRNNSKLSLGGVKVKRKVHSHDRVNTGTAGQLSNRKRSAASIAAEIASKADTSQRHLPRKKRKKQTLSS